MKSSTAYCKFHIRGGSPIVLPLVPSFGSRHESCQLLGVSQVFPGYEGIYNKLVASILNIAERFN